MEWISVKDRLPDEGSHCAVWDGSKFQCAQYLPEEEGEKWQEYVDPWYFSISRCCDIHTTITHWMPLPEQPTGRMEIVNSTTGIPIISNQSQNYIEKKLSIERIRKRYIQDIGHDPFSLMSDENMIKWFENPRASYEPPKDE